MRGLGGLLLDERCEVGSCANALCERSRVELDVALVVLSGLAEAIWCADLILLGRCFRVVGLHLVR